MVFTQNTADDLIISKATVKHAEQIVNFLNAVAGETDFLTFGFNEFPLSVAEEEEFISVCLEKNNSLMLVGHVKGEIASQLFIDVSTQPRLSHIGSLGISVSKKYWGMSIGTRMLAAAIAWAKEKNMGKLQLQVRTDNVSAVALYKKSGFIVEGTITRSIKVHGHYYDEFIMGLPL